MAHRRAAAVLLATLALLLAACSSSPSTPTGAVASSNARITAYVEVARVRLSNLRPKMREAICWAWSTDYPISKIADVVAPPIGNVTAEESQTVTLLVLADACTDGHYTG